MKQVNSDFSKAKVGDPVYHISGQVLRIIDIDSEDYYPIHTNDDASYTLLGKLWEKNTHSEIFTHPVKIIHADDEPFVERVMEVSEYEDFRIKINRLVFAQRKGIFIAWNSESDESIYTTPWPYAREIQPVNPRIAEVERQIQRLKNELETLKEVSK
jgi:hypothetical protein